MAVYVDDLYHWPISATRGVQARRVAVSTGGWWCHMTASSEDELVAFAVRIGMKRSWIQKPGTVKVHFDLTPARRVVAIRNGAVPVIRRRRNVHTDDDR